MFPDNPRQCTSEKNRTRRFAQKSSRGTNPIFLPWVEFPFGATPPIFRINFRRMAGFSPKVVPYADESGSSEEEEWTKQKKEKEGGSNGAAAGGGGAVVKAEEKEDSDDGYTLYNLTIHVC